MRLTFEVRQNMRRLVAVFGVTLAFIVAQAVPALALSDDRDHDGLSSSIERIVTETNPRDADSDNDGVEDGDEDDDCDDDGVTEEDD